MTVLTKTWAQANLSPCQADVVRELVLGYTDKEIARRLGVTKATIRTHITALSAKIGAHNKVQIAVWAIRNGVVPEPDFARTRVSTR